MIKCTNEVILKTVDAFTFNDFVRTNDLKKRSLYYISKDYELRIDLDNKQFLLFDKLTNKVIL